ncbi:MAG TPA: response regulator [Candidatus Angelobacter sp.]|nr:response regulator [Candidatus Angelobacter sp.]
MANVFIVEDDASDLRHAKSLVTNLGVGKVDSASTVGAAVRYLDEIVEGKREAPVLMILDLALGYESGFEVLRRWKSDAHLKSIRVIVWTQMGEREQELCRLFGLEHVVPKWGSEKELQDAVRAVVNLPSQSSQ